MTDDTNKDNHNNNGIQTRRNYTTVRFRSECT